MPSPLPTLPTLRKTLKALSHRGVRVSKCDGEILITTDDSIGEKLEAAMAAYGWEWVGPRYAANGKIRPEFVLGYSNRYDWHYRYEYFVPANS